jgi:hypothetical protein
MKTPCKGRGGSWFPLPRIGNPEPRKGCARTLYAEPAPRTRVLAVASPSAEETQQPCRRHLAAPFSLYPM